jgi:hypothetical protein
VNLRTGRKWKNALKQNTMKWTNETTKKLNRLRKKEMKKTLWWWSRDIHRRSKRIYASGNEKRLRTMRNFMKYENELLEQGTHLNSRLLDYEHNGDEKLKYLNNWKRTFWKTLEKNHDTVWETIWNGQGT